MKKLISFALALAMVLSMVGCGCDHSWEEATCTTPKTCTDCGETEGEPAGHTPGQWVVSAVDTEKLTMTRDLICDVCGEVTDTQETSTGTAPVNSHIPVSPEEWYNCLVTNVHAYGAGQTLYSYPVESDDNALLHSLVTMSQMNAVFSYQDVDGNVITTDKSEARDTIHNIRVDAQFTNDNIKEFYMLLMLITLNNNSGLKPEEANTLAGQIMGGHIITDNGYTYAMEILSAADHRVCVSITAE